MYAIAHKSIEYFPPIRLVQKVQKHLENCENKRNRKNVN